MPLSANASLAEVLSLVLESREAALSKTLPGTVVTYDAATKTALVRPGVHRRVPSFDDPDEDEIEELPAIPNVPVMWPQGRGFSIVPTVGLLPGDPVLLLCCDRDISGWLRTGVPSEPDDARSHSWGSAVAIPGLVHDSYTNAPADALALASLVSARVTALQAKLDTLISKFNLHTHPVSGALAGATLTLETPLGALGSVASSIAKVDA